MYCAIGNKILLDTTQNTEHFFLLKKKKHIGLLKRLSRYMKTIMLSDVVIFVTLLCDIITHCSQRRHSNSLKRGLCEMIVVL